MKYFREAKNLYLIMVFIMILQLLIPTSFAGAESIVGQEQSFEDAGFKAFDAPTGSSLTSSAINVKNVVFKVIEGDDTEVSGGSAGEYLLELGVDELTKSFHLEFDFSLDEDHIVQGGDYYEFTVPTAFDIKEIINKPIKSDGDTIATYSISLDGTVRITFTDEINNGQPVDNGKFFQSWALGSNVKTGELSQEYDFNVAGPKKFIIAISNNNTESINKSDGKHVKNASTVKWSVDVNKQTANIGGKTLNDSMQAQIVPATIKVYELIPKLKDGSIIFIESSALATDGFTLTDGTTFPITFAEGNTKAYRIYYETTITDEQRECVFSNTSKEISNTATLGDTVSDGGKATLSFDPPITKSDTYYDSTKGEIEWEVVVNADNRDISNGITIVDTLTRTITDGNQSADGKHMEYVKGEAGNVTVEITPTPKSTPTISLSTDNKLTISFVPMDDNKTAKHTIKYKTKDDVVDKSYKVSNGAVLTYTVGTKTYTSNNVEKSVSPNMISKSGETGGTIDYENKQIEWNFTFNGSGYKDITDVTITDTFESGKYLKMYKKDFIDDNKNKFDTSVGGTATGNYFNISLSEPKTDEKGEYTLTGFTLNLVGEIDEPVTFTYPTTFDPTTIYANSNIKNSIGVGWKKNDVEYSNSGEFTSSFNKFTKNNGDKTGIYNPINKTIEWKVDVNYNKHTLEKARVVDTFGHKQTMSEVSKNTVKVYLLSMAYGENPKVIGGEYNNYTVTPTGIMGEYTGFELGFNETITQPYRIVYTTKYNEQWIGEFNDSNNKAKNVAILYNDDDKISELDTEKLDKSPEIPNAGKYISKDGRDIKDKDYLEWKLKVNESQSYIKAGSTISDTLNEGQTLLDNFTGITLDGEISNNRGMFEFKKRVYTRNGDNFTSQLVLLTQNEMEELFDIQVAADKKSFTITSKKDINEEYQISYVTDISASLGSELSNEYSYKFEGQELKEGSYEEKVNVTYEFSGASGEFRYYNLTLAKKDGNTPLENVKFGLFKKDLTLVKEATSNEDGLIDFGTIKWGEFILKEVQPQTGYTNEFKVGDSEEFISEYILEAKGKNKDIKIDIYNELPVKIILDKYDITDSTKKLAGAKFEIKNAKGVLVDTIISNETGAATSKDLPPGTYTITETEAPDKYVKVTEHKTVTLESGKNEIVEFSNELINQAVRLTKVDAGDNNIKLKGAKFNLHHFDGTLVTEDVFITGEKGEITVNNLSPGKYYFKEISSPNYYLLPVEESQLKTEFTINKDQTTFTEIEVKNTRGKGSIIITKVDAADNDILLNDVEFTLVNSVGSLMATKKTVDGKIEFTDLPYDTYTITETKAHEDYVPNSSSIEVVLDEDTDGKSIEKTIENTKKDYSVELTKYNSNKSLKLEGAIFELRKEIDRVYEIVKGIDVDKLTTDDNGVINLKDLEVGRYQLIETMAPSGYRLNSDPIEFEIEENQTAATIVEKLNSRRSSGGGGGTPEVPEIPEIPKIPEIPVTPTEPEPPIVNPIVKFGNILINKLDLDSNPLDGAEFTLYDESGTAIRTVASDVNGTALFSNLPLGIYSVMETKAPDGYQIYNDDLLVDLRDAKTLRYNFRNAPEGIDITESEVPLGWEPIEDQDVPTGTGILPDTGSIFGTFMLILIGAVLMLTGFGMLFKRRFIG